MVLVVMRILPLVHQPTEKLRSFAQKSSIATWTTYGRCAMTRRTAVFGIVEVVFLSSLLIDIQGKNFVSTPDDIVKKRRFHENFGPPGEE